MAKTSVAAVDYFNSILSISESQDIDVSEIGWLYPGIYDSALFGRGNQFILASLSLTLLLKYNCSADR